MADEAKSALTIDVTGSVALVTFDRPHRRNAIDIDTIHELGAFLEKADRDATIRAIVLAGSARDYCTGADMTANPDSAGEMTAMDYRYASVDFQRFFGRLWDTETPLVSAVTGTVAGAGWMLALLADLVVAAEGARWTHVFSRRGMVPHAGDPYFLPRIIPFHRLNEIAMLSEPITSETLHSWGIVNRCVAPDQVVATAMDLATTLADGPTRALAMTKRLYRRSLDSDMLTAFEEERSAQALISTTKDRREGMASYLEGRPAKFIGN